jgi:hypothetical protein
VQCRLGVPKLEAKKTVNDNRATGNEDCGRETKSGRRTGARAENGFFQARSIGKRWRHRILRARAGSRKDRRGPLGAEQRIRERACAPSETGSAPGSWGRGLHEKNQIEQETKKMSRNGLIPPKSKRKKKSLQRQNKLPSAEPKENQYCVQGARTETRPGRDSDPKLAPEK